MIGYNSFNFIEQGNSIYESEFFGALLQSTKRHLNLIMTMLQSDQRDQLERSGIIEKEDPSHIHFQLTENALKPKHTELSIRKALLEAGIPNNAVAYIILPELHTIDFKQQFSFTLGSIPISGVWDIFLLLNHQNRIELVKMIYEDAFKNTPLQIIRTHDPMFIIKK